MSDVLPRLLTYKEYATHPRTGRLPCLTLKYRAFVKTSRVNSKRPASASRFELRVTCSFCNSSRRMRSWRLSPACPTAPWSFRSLRKTVCRLLWIWCFPCSLLLGGRPVFRLLPVEGSMPQLGEFYTLIRGGIIPPHPLARVLHPRAPILLRGVKQLAVVREVKQQLAVR